MSFVRTDLSVCAMKRTSKRLSYPCRSGLICSDPRCFHTTPFLTSLLARGERLISLRASGGAALLHLFDQLCKSNSAAQRFKVRIGFQVTVVRSLEALDRGAKKELQSPYGHWPARKRGCTRQGGCTGGSGPGSVVGSPQSPATASLLRRLALEVQDLAKVLHGDRGVDCFRTKSSLAYGHNLTLQTLCLLILFTFLRIPGLSLAN